VNGAVTAVAIEIGATEHKHVSGGEATGWRMKQLLSFMDCCLSGSMCCVSVPDALYKGKHVTYDDAELIQNRLYHEHRIEVPLKMIQEKLYVRISVHIYNELSEYEKLADAVLSMLPWTHRTCGRADRCVTQQKSFLLAKYCVSSNWSPCNRGTRFTRGSIWRFQFFHVVIGKHTTLCSCINSVCQTHSPVKMSIRW